jgi:hypothetical protein
MVFSFQESFSNGSPYKEFRVRAGAEFFNLTRVSTTLVGRNYLVDKCSLKIFRVTKKLQSKIFIQKQPVT